MYRPLKKVIGLFAASALFLTTLSAPVFAEDPSETGAEEPAVSISINDFTEPHPLPTPDLDYVEISLEEYLERLANGYALFFSERTGVRLYNYGSRPERHQRFKESNRCR